MQIRGCKDVFCTREDDSKTDLSKQPDCFEKNRFSREKEEEGGPFIAMPIGIMSRQ